jgi:hypothetical protein
MEVNSAIDREKEELAKVELSHAEPFLNEIQSLLLIHRFIT